MERSSRRNPETPAAAMMPGSMIHDIFQVRAREQKLAVAVRCGGGALTYRELNARANRLARRLVTLGVGPEDNVALFLERGLLMPVAILGTLKAGGAYVPIDLAYPFERIQFMLEDSKPRVLITERKLALRLPKQHACTVLCLDSDGASIESESADDLDSDRDEDRAAYVIYTSGSTGKPKGVVVTHRNIRRLFEATDHWFRFAATDVWTLFHSFAFDFSVWEMWGALLYGGKLVIVPHLISRSPEAFLELLVRERVTVLNQTPSAFRQLIHVEGASGNPLDLRWVIFGGEALELQSLKPWFDRHGDREPRLVNMYGITETTVHVTYRPIAIRDLEAGRGSVIGQPIPDLTLHILDESRRPCPEGVPGEIYVGGAGVARGYLRRPELTAERFIPDPFTPNAGERLYRSGDLARRLPDGDVEYLGRIDQQVKIRGFRIELGEIEAVLNAHPAVREAVVLAHSAENGDKRLTAYVVCRSEQPTVEEVRSALGRLLPEYMIPGQFVFLPKLPLTLNGKVDRAALPAAGRSRPELGVGYAAPESPQERTLAAIWESVLEIAPIGANDNFFSLGGDSIRSIQVLARAQANGLPLSLADLFAHPTIRELARARGAEDTETVETAPAFADLSPADRARLPAGLEDAYPMSKLQIGMVYHSSRDPASAIFHDVFSFRFRLPWDEDKLREAVDRLVGRHAIFRTSFDFGSFGEPLQLVHATADIPFSIEDLRTEPEKGRQSALVAWVEHEKRRPFDWSKAPFFRLHVQRRTDDEFQFIVSFHHAIMDGWSLAAMLTELFQEYRSLLNGEPRSIQPPPIRYRDFVALERRAWEGEAPRAFWKTKLQGTAVQPLPRWPASLRAGGKEQVRGPEVVIGSEILRGLQQLAGATGVPLRTVLLAAHCRVMGVLAGREEVVTGLVSNGRPQAAGGERMIGLFLNTLPFRLQMDGGTWRELVQQTFAVERELLPFRRCPLSDIQQLTGGQPLFESVFDFVQFHVYRDLPGYKDHSFLEDHYFEANDFAYYQTFMLDADGAELRMHCDYDPNQLCEAQIRAVSDYYANTLSAMAHAPEARYEHHSPLPPRERERLLIHWNRTEMAVPQDQGVHELIGAQAVRTPRSVAAVSDQGSLTYAELDRQSNLLAGRLKDLGIDAGQKVGICMERSLEMLISLLGVLKAGAAYVPLDPSYPKARLEFMIEDAGLDAVLTGGAAPELRANTRARFLPAEALLRGDQATGHANAPAGSPKRTDAAEWLAYVIYTSGSTGKPKGVEISHRALANFLSSMRNDPGMAAGDTLLAVTTLSFDIAALEWFLPLTVGGRVVIASRETALDPVALGAALERHQVTVMQATPTTWRSLVQSGWKGNRALKALCGGEPLTRDLANALLERCAEVWNMYGPTETTVWSCIYRVEPGEGPVPIGHPIANTQVYLLDSRNNPVPTGVDGEVYLGGAGLARGYLDRPDLTRERFVELGLGEVGRQRVYRTGDLGRYLPDGRLLCLGRTDHQVKIRGFRIELGEVEAALASHPGVQAAVVAAKDDPAGGKRLVGYYQPSPSEPVATPDLRAFLESRLPGHLMPAAFMALKDFPRTPNGKVDRSALPEPGTQRTDSVAPCVQPRTPLEERIAALWQEILQVGTISIRDNFFTLGGHSLSVIQVVGRLRHDLGVQISLALLFENPTVERFALAILEKLLEADTPSADANDQGPSLPVASRVTNPMDGEQGAGTGTLSSIMHPQ